MDDYISREAVKEAAWEGFINRLVEDQGMYGYLVSLVNEVFDAIPAADVRPVVLCRDCGMYECHEYDGGLKYVCRLFKRQMQEEDFCSYAEKREES